MTNPPTGDHFGGADALPIELESHEAAAGVDKTIALPGGRTFTIRIPPGVTDNMVLRLPGADTSDPSGPKDIFLRVLVKPPVGGGAPVFSPPLPPPGPTPPPWAPPGTPMSGPPMSAPPMSAPP